MTMTKKLRLLFIPLSLIFGTLNLTSTSAKAGITTGADIYCVMRAGGNDHEASWEAAYQNIKKEKAGLFKTSPKQAASIIVEEVVSETDKFNDCIQYLGDLYTPKTPPIDEELTKEDEDFSTKGDFDRYDY